MLILGIDPGRYTGLAIFYEGKLSQLYTVEPVDIVSILSNNKPDRVIYEDSRLQSKVWTSVKGAAALKIARNIGEIDAWCSLINAICDRLNIPCHGISPKGKGAKLDAEQFARLTGWSSSSNQHERDAAHVAWPHRRAK